MTEHCIIRADFSNWRPIQGRKVMQLIFEVPIEEAEGALKMLGIPQPGASKWCAIALLGNNGSATVNAATSPRPTRRLSSDTVAPDGHHGGTQLPITVSTAETGTSETSGHARKFSDFPLSQQSALRCHEPLFQKYMGASNEAQCTAVVKGQCGVASRSEIVPGMRAGKLWEQMEVGYQNWLTDRKFAGAKR